ncbi:MAG: hypothetical protein AAF990_09840 [Bacteroidota bacterium]
MKKLFLFALTSLLFASCSVEFELDSSTADTALPCSEEIDLGFIELSDNSKDAIPYETAAILQFTDENGLLGFRCQINDPNAGNSLEDELERTSDCFSTGEVNAYNFTVEEKYAYIAFGRSTTEIGPGAPCIAIRLTSMMDNEPGGYEKIGEYLHFVFYSGSGSIPEEFYLSIPLEGKGLERQDENNYGYRYYGQQEWNGKTYNDVYANSFRLASDFRRLGISTIYYTLEEGVVAIEDGGGKVWAIK